MKWRLLIWSLGIVLLLFCNAAIAQNYGMETRESIGPFLNNKLPSLPPGTPSGWAVAKAFPNLTFPDPVSVRPEPNSNRLYVCGRQGIIYFFENNPQTSTRNVFLDIRSRTQGWDDCGLLGLAFHPEFRQADSPNRGYVYVYYTSSSQPTSGPSRPPQEKPGFTRLSRFTVPDGSMSADAGSELILINQYDRHLWHNGGAMFFGEDGFLYLSIGDEGGANDDYLSAQKLNDGMFSGVIRIDVNMDPSKSRPIRRQPKSPGTNSPASSTANYFIPNDNPFLDPGGNVMEEFWAIGLRSPHSLTFDPVTKRIWLGDVGQAKWEEINIIERAANYQWPFREGLVNGPKPKPIPTVGTEKPPIHTYFHESGNNCVIGGYIYRGTEHARELLGKYIFGDNISGRIWTLTYDGANRPVVNQLCTMPTGSSGYLGLSGFGLDQNGELLLCKMGEDGGIYKLQRINPSPPPPARLSETGAFADLATLTPVSGIIPYDVNSPLWSDGAAKRRWIAVPSDRRIRFFPTSEWEFPEGTVFIKHFEIPLDENNPTVLRRLETRFLIRTTGNEVYGMTYKWRADQSDADLITEGASEDLTIKTRSGARRQKWSYPSQTECFLCHTANANFVLGINTHQLNGDFNYFARADNQLRTWNHLGLFDPAINENDIGSLSKAVAVNDLTVPLETRVRSYLDANCASCHRPNGVNGYWDARFHTPLSAQGIIDGSLVNALDLKNGKVIAPANLNHSVLSVRMESETEIKMPPLARNLVDAAAVSALSEWVNGMPLTAAIIAEQPTNQNAIAGETLTLRVVTESTAALRYQWRFNGAIIPGATSSVFTRRNAQAADAGKYRVEIASANSSIVSDEAQVTVSPKNFFPIVSIATPSMKSTRVNGPTLLIQGTAGSAAGLAEVRLEMVPGELVVADGTTNWSKTLTLVPGTNTIRAVSVNKIGHESLPETRTVFYVVLSRLINTISGAGTVTPDLNGKFLEIGKNYRITARPARDFIFAGWSGGVFAQEPKLNFIMQSNLLVTANFVRNPFVQWQGSYNGLFYEDEMVRHESSGAFTLRLTSRGTFSGRMLLDGKRLPISGRFDSTGQTQISVARRGTSAISVGLQLGQSNQIDQVVGQVDDGIWNAALLGDRAFLKSPTTPHQSSGQYTLLFPGDGSEAVPAGYGFGAVKIDNSGRVRLAGQLSDDTRISHSAVLSKNGDWPLYVPLYRDKGSLLSWVNFGDSNILENEFSWIKMGEASSRYYPGGFTSQVSLAGSKYVPPPRGGRALTLTNGSIVLSEGNLSTNLTNEVNVSGNDIFPKTVVPGFTLSVQPNTGLIRGRFQHPVTKKQVMIKGAVLQEQNNVGGYFLGPTESGAVLVE